jgi:hypothetical protein
MKGANFFSDSNTNTSKELLVQLLNHGVRYALQTHSALARRDC